MQRRQTKMGFTLIELLVVVAIIALLIGILLPALGEARRTGKLAVALSHLRQFGVAGATYAVDFEDRIYAFTTAPNTQYPDLLPTGKPVNDAARQAIDIIRRRAGREEFRLPSSWIPNVLYTHLVLNDYLAQRLPEQMVVNPEDEHRLNWQDDPENKHDKGYWQPFQKPQGGGAPGYQSFRWPYSSSFQVVPATYDKNQSNWGQLDREPLVIRQANSSCYFIGSGAKLGYLRLSDVTFPSNKVQLHDGEGRHSGRQDLYYAVPEAKVAVQLFDGSAALRKTADANQGWQPNIPTSPEPTMFTYTPEDWQAPTSTGEPDEILTGYYRWTRGGLKGIDFDGDEINTGQQ